MKEGYWHKCLQEARKVRKTHMCPFSLFAQKYGYDLEHGDELIFPESAPEFQRMQREHYGLPYSGWALWYSRMYNLPKNVFIGEVSLLKTMKSYKDKVMLIKFCHSPHIDGGLDDLFDWELVKEPWPAGSYCMIDYQIIRGATVIP